MSGHKELHREMNLEFEELFVLLKKKDIGTWTIFVNRLRKVTVPWLAQRIGKLPGDALYSLDEFVLEVFANALAKYYELFEKGTFTKYQDLQSLMFRVAELKMKEGFAQLKRDQLIYYPSDDHKMSEAIYDSLSPIEEKQQERIKLIQSRLQELSTDDRQLLVRYYQGEKMVDIAQELNIAESSIRKRKQRALDRLKKLVKQTIKFVLFV